MKRNILKRVMLVLMVMLLAPVSLLLTACDDNPSEPANTWSLKGIWAPVSYSIIYNSSEDYNGISVPETAEKFNTDKTKLRFAFDEANFCFAELNEDDPVFNIKDKKYEIAEETDDTTGIMVKTIKIAGETTELILINQNSIQYKIEEFGIDSEVIYYFSKHITNINAELGSWEYLTSRTENPGSEAVGVINENLGIIRFNFNKTVVINGNTVSYTKYAEIIQFNYDSIKYTAKFNAEGKLEISRKVGETEDEKYIMVYKYAN